MSAEPAPVLHVVLPKRITLPACPRCFQSSGEHLSDAGFSSRTCAPWTAFCTSSDDIQMQEEEACARGLKQAQHPHL